MAWLTRLSSSKSFHQICIPNHGFIIDGNVTERFQLWIVIFSTPSAMLSVVRKTAQCFCMAFWRRRRSSVTVFDAIRPHCGIFQAGQLTLRQRLWPAKGFCFARLGGQASRSHAQCLPRVQRRQGQSGCWSPRRFAPCTETQAASPTAIRPGDNSYQGLRRL